MRENNSLKERMILYVHIELFQKETLLPLAYCAPDEDA